MIIERCPETRISSFSWIQASAGLYVCGQICKYEVGKYWTFGDIKVRDNDRNFGLACILTLHIINKPKRECD